MEKEERVELCRKGTEMPNFSYTIVQFEDDEIPTIVVLDETGEPFYFIAPDKVDEMIDTLNEAMRSEDEGFTMYKDIQDFTNRFRT